MFISIHILVLIGVVCVPIFFLPFHWNTKPALKASLYWSIPFLILGSLSLLLLNMHGCPTIEWLLPGLVCFGITAFGRPGRLLKAIQVLLVLSSIFLCGNFIVLVQLDNYARLSQRSIKISEAQNRAVKNNWRDALQKALLPETFVEEGPLAKILRQEAQTYEVVTVEPRWHTFFTQLSHLKRDHAILWYPGGIVRDGSEKLELRKIKSPH